MALPQLSLDALIRACLDTGDRDAWDEFIRRFQPLIANTVVKTLRTAGPDAWQWADDIIQEVFMKLCDRDCHALRGFRPEHEHSFYGFLKTIAFRETQNFLRQPRPRPPAPGAGPVPEPPVRPSQEARLLRRDVRDLLEKVTGPPHKERDKFLFHLYFAVGLTAKEIARIPSIGLMEKGVESRILTLTRRMKELAEEKMKREKGDSPSGVF